MESLSRMYDEILLIDASTLWLLAFICGVALLVIRGHLENPLMAWLMFPLLFGLSVLTFFAFLQFELFVPDKMDQWLLWTVLAATIGTIVGTGIAAVLMQLADRHKKVASDERVILYDEA